MTRVSRRDEIIEEAVAILREEGPAALTSVNVAARIGVTQSAIYRHIVDMDELSGIASRIVVSELTAMLNSILLAPDVNFDDLDGILELSSKIVRVDAARPSGVRGHRPVALRRGHAR